MDSNWTRWTIASIVKHFDALRQGVHLHVEGRERITPEPKKRFELRIDGPYTKELSANYWQLDFEVNVLITQVRDTSDAYSMDRLKGIVQAAFTRTIVARKLGDTPDPGDTLGCLILRSDGREGIMTSEFGLIDASQGLRQATVEGHYRMELRK